MDDAERAQLGGAAIALLLILLRKVRERAAAGKRILPRMRARVSFSIRSPESDPPPRDELEPPALRDPEDTPVMLRRKPPRRRDAEDDG